MNAQESDRLALLFDNHAVRIHRYLLRRVHDSHTIDDLVSEVFLVAARRMSEIPADRELPWLYVTARNVLANWRRRSVPSPASDLLDVASEAAGPEGVGERLELKEAWQALSESDREVLRLAAWEGLTGMELAAALEMTPSAAASALSRARSRLAEKAA